MNAVYISAICVGAAVACSCLKRRWPEIALVTALAAGIWILYVVLKESESIFGIYKNIASAFDADAEIVKIMLKACGISLVAEFASQICRDAGESALSGRIILCSRIASLGIAAPAVSEIFSLLSSLFLPL